MKLKLQEGVSSSQDLAAIILEVHQYAHWLSQNAVKSRLPHHKNDEPPAISPAALDLIQTSADKGTVSQKSLDSLVGDLEDLIDSSPRITITLAAIAPGSLKKTLVTWCREHISPTILVDFRFNSTLLGGMVVQYGSHVYDWSFRRQILAAREQIPEVLRRV